MFPRRKRLSRADFPPLGASGGQRLSSPHFMVVVPQKASGYAVVVSKKVAKLATARHLLKRRVLAALRALNLPQSLIVFPKTSSKGLSVLEIQNDLNNILSKISTSKQ